MCSDEDPLLTQRQPTLGLFFIGHKERDQMPWLLFYEGINPVEDLTFMI